MARRLSDLHGPVKSPPRGVHTRPNAGTPSHLPGRSDAEAEGGGEEPGHPHRKLEAPAVVASNRGQQRVKLVCMRAVSRGAEDGARGGDDREGRKTQGRSNLPEIYHPSASTSAW